MVSKAGGLLNRWHRVPSDWCIWNLTSSIVFHTRYYRWHTLPAKTAAKCSVMDSNMAHDCRHSDSNNHRWTCCVARQSLASTRQSDTRLVCYLSWLVQSSLSRL